VSHPQTVHKFLPDSVDCGEPVPWAEDLRRHSFASRRFAPGRAISKGWLGPPKRVKQRPNERCQGAAANHALAEGQDGIEATVLEHLLVW
jgi:hypothetical protein